MDQFHRVTSSETGSVMREQCQSAHASKHARAHTQTHIQHSRNACFGFLLHCKKSCNTFTVKWPENRDKDEAWIKKKRVPYCLCQVEVVTQDKERKAKKTQSVQNCRHNPGCAGFPCFKALMMIVSTVTVISFWPTLVSAPAGMACSANCYNRDQYLSYKSSIFNPSNI